MTSESSTAAAEVSLEVLTVVEDFFRVETRSETLDGSIPLRAAQGCKPLLDGNGAGFQVRAAVPMVIRKRRSGPTLVLGADGYATASHDYASRIDRLASCGLLRRDGYWHRELLRGIAWTKRDVMYLWTGHLVRPSAGMWTLVSGAWNRRCLVNLFDHVVPDTGRFVPLILRLDLTTLRAHDTWLDTELACLTPLRPNVAVTIRPLSTRTEIGQAYCEFYDASYLDPRARGEYIGRYRKLTAGEPELARPERATCQLVVAGGPRVHRIGTFDRFATPAGWLRDYRGRNTLQFAVVGNICDVSGRWDGLEVRDIDAAMPHAIERLRRHWAALYGCDQLACIESWFAYALGNLGRQRAEPYVNILPWVFAVTPPGWSSIIDACHLTGLDGMRGVISTDSYFSVPPVWHFHKPGRFSVPRGRPLARVLPVPRQSLRTTFVNRSLDDSRVADLRPC